MGDRWGGGICIDGEFDERGEKVVDNGVVV